jgi:hypothetical protein
MKFPAIFATVVLASSSVLFAEDPTPGTPPSGLGAKPAAKAPLASNDKKFVKEQTESLYFVMDLIGEAKTSATTDTVKKLGEKVKPDLDKVWADLAGFATDNGEMLPKELKGAEKSAAERLKKGDKKNWDKEFLKITSKEVKKVSHAFKDTNSLSSPALKKIASDWGVLIAGFDTQWDAAEKEVAKAKL